MDLNSRTMLKQLTYLIAALCIFVTTGEVHNPGDAYDHIKGEHLAPTTRWMEVGFLVLSNQWTRVEATYLNFTDPVVFLSLPSLQVASSVALRVNNTHLDYIGNGLKRFSFDARSYGVQDEYCDLTYYTPSELTVASSFVGWLVVERGMFNVSHHAFIVSADTINRTNSDDDSDPRNQFKSFAPSGVCGGKNCRLNNAAAYLSIAQLQTTRFDRFLLLRGISRGRRFVVYVLTPHDSAQEANYFIPDPGEVYAWMLFEAGLAVTCTENLVMETKLYNVNFQAISVSFTNVFSSPPALFGMVNSLNGRDSLGLRAYDVTESSAKFITQEDKCFDQETTHVVTEETSVLIIGQASVGSTRCGATFNYIPPTRKPTVSPTLAPTSFPTTANPTYVPTFAPTTPEPTPHPTVTPTSYPTGVPSGRPTSQPSSGIYIIGSFLSADGFTVTVEFNVPTNEPPLGRSGVSFPCDEVIEFSLASASLCSWTSSTILKASLYANTAYVAEEFIAASEVGTVNVVSGLVGAECPLNLLDCSVLPSAEPSDVVVISLPTSPLPPVPALSTSSRYSSCDALALDPSGSTGRAGLTWKEVRWEVSGPGNIAPLLAFLNANYTEHTDSRIFVPSDLANAAGTFTVTLILTNFFDLVGSASVSVSADDGKIRPSVSIFGSQNVLFTRDQTLRLFVKASVPACLGVGLPRLSHTWRIWNIESNEEYSFQSTSKDPRRFHLPKYSLNSSTVYVAEVVSIVDDPRVVSSSYSVTITVDALYGTKAQIRGGGLRTVSSGKPFLLDASESYHLDQPDTSLQYRWECVDVTFGIGTSCDLILQDSAQVTVSENGNSERTLIFSVYVSSTVDAGVSIATVTVEVQQDVLPVISMGTVADKVDPLSYVKVNCTINTPYNIVTTWSSPEIDSTRLQSYSAAPLTHTFEPGVHLFTLKMNVGLLDPGRVYTFEVSALSSSDSVSRAQVLVIANTVPYRGVVEVSPTSGVAVSTTFFLETKSWIADADNYPLQYRMSYYTTDSSARLSLLASGVVPYAEAVLRAGDSNFDYAVTCVAEAVDIFGSAGEVSRVVSVYPSGDSLSSDSAGLIFEAVNNATDYDRVDQLLAGYANLFTARNCSLAPNCTDLYREPCSEHPQTCGKCLAGYIGLDAPSNFHCVLKSDVNNQVLNGECARDADCTSYQCADGLCVSEVIEECPGSCSGHGQCVALNSNRVILPSCSVFDPFCAVECRCHDGFYGVYCEYNEEMYHSALSWQELLCSDFSDLLETSDLSAESSLSRSSIMSLLFKDLSLLTAEAFAQCTSVMVRTISDDPALSSDEIPFQYWMGVLSSAVAATDDVVRPEIRELLFDTVLLLSTGAHVHLVSESSIDLASEHIRIISRMSYPQVSERDEESFVIPRTEFETAAGFLYGTITSHEISPFETTEVGYVYVLYLNIPAGVLGNATTVSLETTYYADDGNDGTGRRRRLQSSIVDRNVTVTLQNVVEFEAGDPTVEDEVLVECAYNLVDGKAESYTVATICGEKSWDVTCTGNSSYSVVVDCYSIYFEPQCRDWGNDGLLDGLYNCTVIDYTKWNTTCLCKESFSVLSLPGSSAENSVSRNYGVLVTLVAESFASRFNTFNSFSQSTVRRNSTIFTFIILLVLILFAGGIIVLIYDFKHVEYAAIREKYVESNWKRVRSFKMLVKNTLPTQFSSLPWHLRYKALLVQQHEWLALIFSTRSNYAQHNNFISLLWVHAFGKLINFFFVGTVLAVLYFADDDTCEAYSSRNSCLKPVGINFRSSLCEWSSDTQVCSYRKVDVTFLFVLSVAVAINILVAPVDSMLRFLIQMTRRLLTTEEDRVLVCLAGRKDRSLESYKSGELSKMQTTQSKVMCVVRMSNMKNKIDNAITTFGEMDNFLELHREKRLNTNKRMSTPTLRHAESVIAEQGVSRLRRDLSKWKFIIQESMYDVPAHITERQQWEESLFRSDVWRSTHVYWLLYNMRLAKHRARDAVVTINSLPDDDTRDEFLLRLFFVEAMVGYRRQIASLFFMDQNKFGYRTGIRSSRSFQLGCTLFIALYLIFFCLYIFLFGVSIGPSATNLWLVCICFAYLQNILLIEPVLIFVYGITIAGLIYKDVTTLASRIRLHGKKILTRHRGTSFNPSAHYIHHINAACRAARNVPHLVVSRLLISFNDWDLPVNFAPRYHQTGGLASCLRAVLFFQAMCALAFLYFLPTVIQECIIEVVLSIIVGFVFSMFYLSLQSGPGYFAVAFVVFFILLALICFICNRWYSQKSRPLRFDSNKHDSAGAFKDVYAQDDADGSLATSNSPEDGGQSSSESSDCSDAGLSDVMFSTAPVEETNTDLVDLEAGKAENTHEF